MTRGIEGHGVEPPGKAADRADWFHLDPPRHQFVPSASGLLGLLDQQGFQVLECKHWSLEQNPFGILQSALNRRSGQRDALYERLKSGEGSLALPHKLQFLAGMPLAVVFAMIESVQRRGGTIELVARRKPSPSHVA